MRLIYSEKTFENPRHYRLVDILLFPNGDLFNAAVLKWWFSLSLFFRASSQYKQNRFAFRAIKFHSNEQIQQNDFLVKCCSFPFVHIGNFSLFMFIILRFSHQCELRPKSFLSLEKGKSILKKGGGLFN